MPDLGRARQRAARRAPSRNENRGASPEVSSIAECPLGLDAFFLWLARHLLTKATSGNQLDPVHHARVALLEPPATGLGVAAPSTISAL